MKSYRCHLLWLAVVILAAMTTLLLARTTMDIKLQELLLGNTATLTRIQLFEQSGLRMLAASDQNVSIIDNLGGQAKMRPIFQISSDIQSPAWEAQPLADNSFSWVYTQVGSAVSWIMSRSSSEAQGSRLHSKAFAVYTEPHYVKGDASGATVTAILHEEGLAQVELFTRHAPTGFVPSQPLDQPRAFLTDARLLRDSSGYWLFLLMPVAGAIADPQAREIGRGTRLPGFLHAIRLDQELKSSGSLICVFSDWPVYEFDVTQSTNQRVAVFATTPAGAIFALGTLGDGPMPNDAWKETRFTSTLASPSLLIHDATAHLAAIQGLGGANATVVYGSLSLETQ